MQVIFPWLHLILLWSFSTKPLAAYKHKPNALMWPYIALSPIFVITKSWPLWIRMLILTLHISILKCGLHQYSKFTLYQSVLLLNLKVWFNRKTFNCDLVLHLKYLKIHSLCPFDSIYYEKWFLFYWWLFF